MAAGQLASRVITLDTSAIIAVANEGDPDHLRVSAALTREPSPWLVPAGILAEIAYMLESSGLEPLDAFLQDLESGAYTLESDTWQDVPRIRELARRYQDLPLGFADAAVVACAERRGGRVLTVDEHFQIVSGEGRITVVPGYA